MSGAPAPPLERAVDLVIDGAVVRIFARDLSPATRLAFVDLLREARAALAAVPELGE